MKTIKIVIISVIAVGFMVWLWPNQPNSVTEQGKREFGADNSQILAPLRSGSVSGSVVQNQIANNATQPSNLSPPYVLFTSNRLSLEVSSLPLQAIVDKIAQRAGITIVMSEAMDNPPTTNQFHELSIEQALHRNCDICAQLDLLPDMLMDPAQNDASATIRSIVLQVSLTAQKTV